jgi:hypothetical protein
MSSTFSQMFAFVGDDHGEDEDEVDRQPSRPALILT